MKPKYIAEERTPMKRQRTTYTSEFKLQMVKLYENGKKRADIVREYDLTASALDRWIKDHQKTGSFRGSEFDNQLMIEATEAFEIKRSLSAKGCPYDNAVAEATYKSFKVEFVYQYTFDTLEQLEIELFDYVHWFNHIRIHQTLGYLTPKDKQRNIRPY